jgi:hypothetical protein
VPKLVPHGGPVSALKTASLFLLVFLAPLIVGCGDDETPPLDTADHSGSPVTLFTDKARLAPYPARAFEIWNDHPGVVVFECDRDGDMDFYVTSLGGYPNRLYRNGADGVFTDVAAEARVAATHVSISTMEDPGLTTLDAHIDAIGQFKDKTNGR